MKRLARNPDARDARTDASARPLLRPGMMMFTPLLAMLIGIAASLTGPTAAFAQDPSQVASGSGKSSAFAKPKGGIFGPNQKIDKSKPLYLQADNLVYDSKGSRVVARGNVEIYFNNNVLTADEVIYDQSAGTLTAVGNVALKDVNGNVVRADRYTLTDDFRDGFVESLSVVSKDQTRIQARQAVRREGNVNEFQDGKFTPCKSKDGMPPLWCISAARIIHDQQAATITYQDAYFEVFGQPIAYMPYFQHADPSVKRRSGFLMPQFVSSTDLGFAYEQPYYFALAPNYDFTFHPMFSTKRGVLWQGDWRHKLYSGVYSIKASAIDDTEEDRWRGSVETKGLFSLSSWWKFGWDVTYESDDAFRRFYKLDNILLTDRVNSIFLRGQSDRNYFGATLYQFGGLMSTDTPRSEALVHPVIDYNYVFADPVLGGELTWNSNAVSLSRDDVRSGVFLPHENVNRVSTEVKWRRQLTDAIGISYTPSAELRGDVFQFDNSLNPVTHEVISDDTVARGLATGSFTVSYPWIASSAAGSHIVEPISQVVVHQASVSQRRLPNEDARSLIFDDTNLFETNKFSGWDRTETGARVNYGLQYTFQSNSGPYARLLIGESVHLSGDNPYTNPGTMPVVNKSTGEVYYAPVFTPTSGLESTWSDYVIGAYLAPSSVFRLISQSRFDQDDFTLRREDVSARLNFGPVTAQATYTYNAIDPTLSITQAVDPRKGQQEIFGLLGLKLTDRWSIQGLLRYDIDASKMLQDQIQLRYGDECFVLTASYTETYINDPIQNIKPDRAVMLRFEFKHLGQFQYKTNILDAVTPTAANQATHSGQ